MGPGHRPTRLQRRIAAQARRFGSISWSTFMDAALYDAEDGFYESGGAAGRRRDFVTGPELGPLFATVSARALDAWWDELGQPDPYVVVEAGAGSGTLARDVLAAEPACAPALRYVLVERSGRLREEQIGRVPLELPAFVLGPSLRAAANAGTDEDEVDESPRPEPRRGPLVTSLAELPALSFRGVVFANELLDNLPFDLVEWRDTGWHEVRVAASDDGHGDNDGSGLVEVVVPAPPEMAAEAERLIRSASAQHAPHGAHHLPGPLSVGARVPLEREAARWLRQALALLEAGRVVAIDYADTTAALARSPWRTWLRTFRHHQPGGAPLDDPGRQDITCVVAIDQLAAVRPATTILNQADWLAAHGLHDLVDAARAKWQERAAIGDLEAVRARSRVHEATALTDLDGLGAFRVLEWVAGSTV